MKVLVTGATGFIGRRLTAALGEAGHDVWAMTRNPDQYDGTGHAVIGDVTEPDSLAAAASGCHAVYYLVHSLGTSDQFGEVEVTSARNLGLAAANARVDQIIYLGGLGREGDDLSEHLASRHEVEGELTRGGVPVTSLRAALVIGPGSASFELLRQFVVRLPVLVMPPQAERTRVQPIAIEDVLRYLVGVLGCQRAINATFEVGGPEVVTYAGLVRRMAELSNRSTRALPVPVVPPLLARLSARLVTDVDPQLAANLFDSLGNDVVVTDDRLARLLPGDLMDVEAMLRSALAGWN